MSGIGEALHRVTMLKQSSSFCFKSHFNFFLLHSSNSYYEFNELWDSAVIFFPLSASADTWSALPCPRPLLESPPFWTAPLDRQAWRWREIRAGEDGCGVCSPRLFPAGLLFAISCLWFPHQCTGLLWVCGFPQVQSRPPLIPCRATGANVFPSLRLPGPPSLLSIHLGRSSTLPQLTFFTLPHPLHLK